MEVFETESPESAANPTKYTPASDMFSLLV